MDYSQQQADPRRHLVGFIVVVLLHALIVYALVSGLAKKVIDVVRAPIETKVIEEVRKPPPPPDVAIPPPPMMAAPPPPFVPPPEVQIAAPPPAPSISVATATPPPSTNITPMTVPTPPQPAAVQMSAAVVCSNFSAVMGEAAFPKDAMRLGLDRGDALIQFTLGASGEIRDVKPVRASHPVFARNSMRLVGEYKCRGQGRDVLVQVPFAYRHE